MNPKNTLKKQLRGRPTSDGNGVKLTRLIGTALLADYIGGFPSHPQRGFESVTYMLKGKMRDKDSAGNEGLISEGDIQWMTAGSGIIHSEMPEQTEGEMSGFQLWVDLPKSDKMTAPKNQEFKAADIPVEQRANGVNIKVIAGRTQEATLGAIQNSFVDPNYWDVMMPAGNELMDCLAIDHNAFVYIYDGVIEIDGQNLKSGELVVLNAADTLHVNSHEESRFLVISGQPLNEPVARYRPFMMSDMDEINQALADCRDNLLVKMRTT